jgi:hypothetical protein
MAKLQTVIPETKKAIRPNRRLNYTRIGLEVLNLVLHAMTLYLLFSMS